MNDLEKKERQVTAIKRWHDGADRNRETAQSMMNNKHYDWSLYIYHLALEKLLKALVVFAGVRPKYTHDLEVLSDQANLDISEEQRQHLREITSFNMEARYEEEKLAFYEKATPEYTRVWHEKCDNLYLWLKKKLQSNLK